jgi:hypothetical protein
LKRYLGNIKKTSSLFFCLFFLALLIGNTGCKPLEAITDTYAEIIDGVAPEDENKEENVGEVTLTANTFADSVTTYDVTVFNQLGNRLVRPVEVTCVFTDKATQTVVSSTTGVTVDGRTTCSFVNGSEVFVFYFVVATAEGVSSPPTNVFLGPVSSN